MNFSFDISNRPTINEIHELYRTNQAKPSEVVEYFLSRIGKTDPEINAFYKTTEKVAIEQAAKWDLELEEILKPNEFGMPISDLPIRFATLFTKYPLFGIPFATKAIIQLEGEVFNASSKIMDGFVAPFSATVIEKILAAGAILVGITNMDQWAMGSSGESCDFGNIKNPFDTTRTPGGSSSGAAASVGSGQVVFSLGSDTGGSIRQPAAFCDVVGLKPTYGLVSRWGVMPMASSLDQVGAITNTVAENILVNKILAGKDQKDQTTIESGELITNLEKILANLQNENVSKSSAQNLTNQNSAIDQNDPVTIAWQKMQKEQKATLQNEKIENQPKKFKIGLPKEFYIDGIDPIIRQSLLELQAKLVANGYEMVEVDLPLTKYAVAVYYMTMGVEVASNLERIDGVRFARQGEYENLFFDHRDNFGDEAKRRIMLGTYASSSGYYDAFYNQAQKVRELARLDFDKAFEKCDLILTPTTPEFPFKLGAKTEDPLKMYLSDVFTCGINPVRIPGLSVPLGLFEIEDEDETGNKTVKLPTGCQILAPELCEDKIYELALEIERIVENSDLSKV